MAMVTCWTARAVGCALGMGMLATGGTSGAKEVAVDQAGSTEPTRRRDESVRVDLGVGLLGGGGLGGTIPVGTAALEVHLGGPAWLVVAGGGGAMLGEAGGVTSSSSAATLRVGPRLEWPVVGRFDAGIHGFATGSFTRFEVSGLDSHALDAGGVAGGSIHYRATDVFGVRVAIDVLRGGFRFTDHTGTEESWGHVQVAPSPAGELTFTF